METTSLNWVGLWVEWLQPILQFLVGLGLVIFVHELGHFSVAKAVGIRVEQFALGFGPRLFGFKRGETEYRVNIVPMGGYVKMAGQEDFGALREGDARDPRSFSNKPVSVRFAVIAAGVVMNALLAAALFVVVCLVGIRFPAPVVGGTLLGSAAQDARIQWQGVDHAETQSAGPATRQPATFGDDSIGLKPGDSSPPLPSWPSPTKNSEWLLSGRLETAFKAATRKSGSCRWKGVWDSVLCRQ